MTPRRSDRSPWNWLLLVPIVVPLLVPLYNAVDPTLFGWPLFYWLQLAFVALGVVDHLDRLPDDPAQRRRPAGRPRRHRPRHRHRDGER